MAAPLSAGGTAAVLRENEAREAALSTPYDPITGTGSLLPRVAVPLTDTQTVRVPWPMARDLVRQGWAAAIRQHGSLAAAVHSGGGDVDNALAAFVRLRLVYDYEFWLATCAKIVDKDGNLVPFVANGPQRRSLRDRELAYWAGRPVRQVELKPRQYGSSTEKQAYAYHVQNVRAPHEGRRANGYIISLDASGASDIAARYIRIAEHYPDGAPGRATFSGVLTATNTKQIEVDGQAGGALYLGSAERPNAPSGRTVHVVLISEIGKMASTAAKGADKLVTNLMSTVPLRAGTCVMLESTADDVGDYFRSTVTKARRPPREDGTRETIFDLTFVSALDFEAYRLDLTAEQEAHVAATLAARGDELDEWEAEAWAMGAALSQIAWARVKRTEYDNLWQFRQEFPLKPDDAWAKGERRVIPAPYVATARKHTRAPVLRGELVADGIEGKAALSGITFVPDPKGRLLVWERPGEWPALLGPQAGRSIRHRYLAAADVGGPSATSDPSVTAILDRAPRLFGGLPRIVAEWHGHDDVDLYAWASVRLATWYDNALWAPEVNYIINKASRERGVNYGETVIDLVADVYPNVFHRVALDEQTGKPKKKLGYHMNTTTKPAAVTALVRALRGLHQGEGSEAWEHAYVERCAAACDEMDGFIVDDGKQTHRENEHDDRVDTRAILLYVDGHESTPAVRLVDAPKPRQRRPVSAAGFT